MTSALRQESVVEVVGREVRVVSHVVLEPEVIVVTELLVGDVVHKKSHIALPPAAVRDFERRGPDALTGSLYALHLRYVRRLLSVRPRVAGRRPAPAGVLGTMVLGEAGQVISSAGEDHVPGAWLRAPYLLSALADRVGSAFGIGRVDRLVGEGDGVTLLLVREGEGSAVAFVGRIESDEQQAGLEEHLREIACAPR